MDKQKIRLWTVSALLVIVLLGVGFGAGFLTHQFMTPQPRLGETAPEIEAQEVGQAAAETVLPTAKIERVTRYLYCMHETSRLEDAREFAGMDAAAVQQAGGDWTLTYFSRERVVLTQEYNGYCPDHLVLRTNESGLGVYRTDPKTGEETEISRFEIDIEDFTAEVRHNLEDGMPFENLAEIESYIEDLES